MENFEKLLEGAISKMEEDTEQVMLDNHFRVLLRRYERYQKSFAYNSDRIIVDKWLQIFHGAPAAEKMARNGLMLLLMGHLSEFGCLKHPFTDMRNCSANLNCVLDNYQGISMPWQCEAATESTESDTSEPSRCTSQQAITEVSSELASSDQDPSSAITVIRNLSHKGTSTPPGRQQPSSDNVKQKVQSFEKMAATLDSSKGSEHLLNYRKTLAKRTTSYNLPRLCQDSQAQPGQPQSAGLDEFASLSDLKVRFEELAKRLLGVSRPKVEQPAAECVVPLRAASSLGDQIRRMAECNQSKEATAGGRKDAPRKPQEHAKILTQRNWEESVSPAPSLGEQIRIMTQRKDEPKPVRAEGGAEKMQTIRPRYVLGKHVRFIDQRSWDQCFKEFTEGAKEFTGPSMEGQQKQMQSVRHEKPQSKDAATEWTPRMDNPSSFPTMEPRFKDATTEWTPRDGEIIEKSSPKPLQDDRTKIRHKCYKEQRSKDAALEDHQEIGRSQCHKEPPTKETETKWPSRDEQSKGKSNSKPQLEDQQQSERTPGGFERSEDTRPSMDERVRMLTKRNKELRRQCLVYYHEDGRLRQNPTDASDFKRLSKGFESGIVRGMQRIRRWRGAPHSLKFFSTIFSKCRVGVGHTRLRRLDRRLEQMATRWLHEQLRLRRERVWSLYRQSLVAKCEPQLTPRMAKQLQQLFESRKAHLLEQMAHTAKLKELWVEHCLGRIRDQQLQQVLQTLDEKYLKLVKGLNKLVRRQEKLSSRNARPSSCSLINLI